jgi:nucleoside 2-deoxyribosyltransferase
MIVYLAGPIDFNKNSQVSEHRYQITQYFKRYRDAWVFDPSKAWSGAERPKPDGFVHWSNLLVLEQADLLVAVLMRDTLTVGTVLEIEHAVELGIPVVVVGDADEDSISLTALGVDVIDNIAEIRDGFVQAIQEESKHREIIERRTCECLALHASDANCLCAD